MLVRICGVLLVLSGALILAWQWRNGGWSIMSTTRRRTSLLPAPPRGTHLVSAACLPYEVGNALSAMVKRRRIDGEMAIRVYKEFERIPVRLLEVNMGRAIQIAAEENHYAYDAYYVACALEAGLPLYSLDVRMVEIARKRGIVCW